MNRKQKSATTPSFFKELMAQRTLHLMLLPCVILVILFNYLPMFGIIIAFKNFNIFQGFINSPWARNGGFEHFIDFFTMTQSMGSLFRNTIGLAVLKLIIGSFPPLILAIVFNELKAKRFKKIVQSISYVPHFVSWIVVTGLITYFFNQTENSVMNRILLLLNIVDEPVNFLHTHSSLWTILIVSDIWKGVGFGSIIYLAVITGIDPEQFEAVEIDGGGRWIKIRHVIWPAVTGTFVILFILAVGRIMDGGGSSFDQLYILGNPLNRRYADIFSTYILRVGLEGGRLSFATAVGLFNNTINLILLISANRISKYITGKSLF